MCKSSRAVSISFLALVINVKVVLLITVVTGDKIWVFSQDLGFNIV